MLAGELIEQELVGMGLNPDHMSWLDAESNATVGDALESLKTVQPFGIKVIFTTLLRRMSNPEPAPVSFVTPFEKERLPVFMPDIKVEAEKPVKGTEGSDKKMSDIKKKAMEIFRRNHKTMFSPPVKDVISGNEESAMYPKWEAENVQNEVRIVVYVTGFLYLCVYVCMKYLTCT